jgi:hypothetical protein
MYIVCLYTYLCIRINLYIYIHICIYISIPQGYESRGLRGLSCFIDDCCVKVKFLLQNMIQKLLFTTRRQSSSHNVSFIQYSPYVLVFLHINICKYIYICIFIYINIFVCVYLYILTYLCAYIYL